MIQPSMLVITPRIKERLASRRVTLYRILLVVKHRILRCSVVQWGIALVHLYTCLNARYICVAKAERAVPIGVKGYGHIPTSKSRTVRARFKRRHDDLPARAAGLS